MKLSKLTRAASFLVVGLVSAKAVFSGKKGGDRRTSQARQAVETENAKFRDAVRLGKTADIAPLYGDEASVLPPNQGIVKGRAAIEGFWKGCLDMGVKDVVLTTADVSVRGDTIYEIGTYTLKIWPDGQSAFEDSGKYVVIWVRAADGALKIQTDIWNSDLPVRR